MPLFCRCLLSMLRKSHALISMAPLFGSRRALLGQAGERTPLLLSELPFRDAKYDPIEPPSPTLTTYSSCQPSHAQKPPPTHPPPALVEKRKKVRLWSSDPCQAWALCQSAKPSPLPASLSDSVLMILKAVRAQAHHTSHKALSWVSLSPQSATQSVVDSA